MAAPIYCTHKELKRVFPQLDSFDGKKPIYGWNQLFTHASNELYEADTEDKQALIDFQMAFGNQIKKHKRQLKRELKLLGGSKKVHIYLEKELDMTVDQFYWKVTHLVRESGESIIMEGQAADARVQLMSQSVLDELESETKQEAREARDEAKLEASDNRWKVLADNFRAHSKFANVESQDQKVGRLAL